MCQTVFHEGDTCAKHVCLQTNEHVPKTMRYTCPKGGRRLWQIFMGTRQKHMCQSQYAARDRDTCAKDNRHPDANKGCPWKGLTSLTAIHPTVISQSVVLQAGVITPVTKFLSTSNTTENQHPHETQHHTHQLCTPVSNEAPCPLFRVVLSCLHIPLYISLTSD